MSTAINNGKQLAEPSETEEGLSDTEADDFLSKMHFRMVRPVDIPRVVEIEKASYPPTEAASKSDLQYRQHHAAPYFRCAVIGTEEESQEVIGYICSTRCHEFEHESMSTHHSEGPLLAIHSVVVTEDYRRKGVATAMLKDYINVMRDMPNDGVQKLVLLAKRHLLSFYVDCGFSVVKPSAIVHGPDQWYDLELDLSAHKVTGFPYCVVDAFANVDVPGSGNPAAVVIMQGPVDPTNEETQNWMLVVSKEFNLSETAFVWPFEEPKQGKELHWNIRYFTPKMEIGLCGHATLAAAGILYRTLSVKNTIDTVLVFHAKEVLLEAQLPSGGLRSMKKRPTTKIAMKFPAKPPKEITETEHVEKVHKILWEAFKVPSDVVLFTGMSEIGDVFVELTPEAFAAIGYDNIQYGAFLEWDGYQRGFVVTCCAPPLDETEEDTSENASANGETSQPLDFLSRFFAPKAGINEDPATGSAHCSLGPYYSRKFGKEKVTGKQMSERGGVLECHIDESFVTLIGTTVQTMSGSLLL